MQENSPTSTQTGTALSAPSSLANRLSFTDVCFQVSSRKSQPYILSGVTGSITSGSVLAILGPSGAGKTTLLNVLTLTAFGGVTTGRVTLNDKVLTNATFARECVVVAQEDNHWSYLTCRETLVYAATLLMPQASAEEISSTVGNMLDKMGLNVCADTRVGNAFVQGLSGGQKRRLSLAVALLKKPAVVFLDEPTSGLDAAAAANVMSFIGTTAVESNLIVVATIHQPASEVFDGFDKIMLLSQGKVAYMGGAVTAPEYFGSIGYPCPERTNPADHMLGLVNAEFTDPVNVAQVLAAYESSDVRASRRSSAVSISAVLLPSDRSDSFCRQVTILLRRHSLLVLRDPMIYLGRCIMFVIGCTFFSIVYYNSKTRVQTQIVPRLFLLMWLVAVPTALGVVAVYAYNTEFFSVRKEVKNGMYKPMAFIVSNAIIQAPFMIVLSMCTMTISGYAIGNWYGPNYATMVLVYATVLAAFESFAQVFAVICENPMLGMLLYMFIWFASFLFCGLMVPRADVMWPFRAFCYVLPLNWGLRSMIWLEFIDTEFGGAQECSAGDGGVDTCFHHVDGGGDAIEPGWNCGEGSLTTLCMGRNGDQVLGSLGLQYQVISSEGSVEMDVTIILGVALVGKLAYVALFNHKCMRASSFSVEEREKREGGGTSSRRPGGTSVLQE